MTRVSITGYALWTPHFPSAEDWFSGTRLPEPQRPEASLIPRRQQRRATQLGRMLATALPRALAQAQLAPADVALILASAGGELENTFTNLGLMMQQPPSSSPLRFGNSVYNAALGQLALPTDNRRFASAIAVASEELAATTLIEAMGWVHDSGVPAALCVADEQWPGETFQPLGIALIVSPASEHAIAHVQLTTDAPTFQPPAAPCPAVRANPCGDVLDLIASLRQPGEHVVALGRSPLRARVHVPVRHATETCPA